MPTSLRKLLWFIAIWAASILALAMLSFVIRQFIA